MSPLLRDVMREINNQGRSQTSEQDEASFEHRRPKVRIPWNFFFQKSQSWAKIKTRQLQLQLGSERRRDGGGKGDRGLKKERKKEVYYHYQ